MAVLPIDESISRFKENENRLDGFVNGDGYTTTGGQVVESVPDFIARKEAEIDATDAIAQTQANKESAAASATIALNSSGSAAASAASASSSATAAAASAAAASSGILGKQTKALLDADLAHAADKIAYVTNDSNTANNGYYIKLGASGSGSWQKSSYDVVSVILKMGRLARNSGAAYPFKQMTRGGTTSPEHTNFSNCILEVRVANARPDEFYKVAYMQNEASLDGESSFDWIIQAFDKSTYATAGTGTILVGYKKSTYGEQQQLVRDGSIQTVSLYPISRPEMRFDITVDTSKLPAAGSPLNAYDKNTNAGWSWIIDPSCYQFKDTTTLRSTDPIPTANLPASLVLDQGKQYPNRVMTRNAVTSGSNSFLLEAILKVRVENAEPGFYYGIRYFKNGTTLVSGVPDGWIIEKQAIADYETSESKTDVITLGTTSVANIVRDKGIQTIVLESSIEPGLRFYITLDPSKFPAYGTFVKMNFPTDPGYSWIIDPSCYEINTTRANSLTINGGKQYPNRVMTRNAVTSGSNSFLLDCVLDVKVKGAREGFYYGIRYFKNGTTALPGPADGWTIEEQSIASYGTTFDADRVITYTDPAPDIPRGGIQTVRLVSPRVAGMEFLITLDTDKLPAYETYISMLNEGKTGRSWIIDPSCYEYENAYNTVSDTLSYSSDSVGNMSLIWQSGSYLYRLRFGPNGYNNLPNIEGIDRAPLGDRSSAAWVQINTAGTDWLPPMVVQAVNNGDGKGSIYTGGNHGADGGAGGGNTARNILYRIYADGQPMQMGSNFNGDAKKISAVIVNELMAYNTTGTIDPVNFPARYVLRQTFSVDIYPGSMEVRTEVRAYEDIVVKTDNGPQMVTVGFQESLLYVGGQYENRLAFDATTNSGSFASYPDCWALVLQNSTNGQQVSWMDRKYEAGDGRYIGGTAAAIRGGGATNTKFYHAVVASYSHNMAAGQTYKWRGGYAWQAPDLEGSDFDSLIVFHKGGEQCSAIVKTASNFTVLP